MKVKLDGSINRKFTGAWGLNNSLLKEKWPQMEMKKKVKTF